MKKYYVRTIINMQAKNKAWEELQQYALLQNGMLINGDEQYKQFRKEIVAAIKFVNSKYPRCTDIEFKSMTGNSVYAAVGEDQVFTIQFLEIKKER